MLRLYFLTSTYTQGTCNSNWDYMSLPAADRTFSASPGNEKVKKTIVDDVAMLAPSPDSFTVTCVGRGSSITSSYKQCECTSNIHEKHIWLGQTSYISNPWTVLFPAYLISSAGNTHSLSSMNHSPT